MKAVIYARYSSDNQREESIEGQIRECTAFAEKNGITILRHYIDRAFSAKTDNRPEFQNMIKDSGKRLFDMIIVWKLDRFARNRYDSARYKATLKKNGVKVVSATEVISDGAEGIILESVLEGYAEYYSADLSEKVVRGMTENALKSKYNGGTRPIGYLIDNDQYFQIEPLTAPFVREAFQRYDEGATMTAIRDWLNEQGIKNTRGQKMTYNSVQHLLNNRRYIGEYTYRDVVVPDGIPAIVPQDLFDRVQEKLAKNKKAPARHKAEDEYLLTTKLFCGYCGAYLCGESGTSHTGNVHHYYKCVSVKKKRTECHKKSVRKEWIEDLVVSETMKMVMDDKAIEAIVSMLMDLLDRENVNLPLYEQQLRETDTAIQNLLNAIQQGILTKSTKGRLEELEATKEELETKIACEKLAKPKVSAEFMTFWLHRFRKLDVRQKSHRKMLIDTFINAIFLYDDKMVITFNYKEGTTTITFDDLKTALADQKTGSDLDCSTAPDMGNAHDLHPLLLSAGCFSFALLHCPSPPAEARAAGARPAGIKTGRALCGPAVNPPRPWPSGVRWMKLRRRYASTCVSRYRATPSCMLASVTAAARRLTRGVALSMATPMPAAVRSVTSLLPSPKAMACSGEIRKCAHSFSSALPLLAEISVISKLMPSDVEISYFPVASIGSMARLPMSAGQSKMLIFSRPGAPRRKKSWILSTTIPLPAPRYFRCQGAFSLPGHSAWLALSMRISPCTYHSVRHPVGARYSQAARARSAGM